MQHVAIRHVISRRRKAMSGIRAALRHGPPPDVPAPSGLAVDVDRALAALPGPQRAVMVLHQLGLDTEAIAHELNISHGTAKSRLARGRAALSPLLREDRIDHG